MNAHTQAGSEGDLKSGSPTTRCLRREGLSSQVPWGESGLKQSPLLERQPGEEGRGRDVRQLPRTALPSSSFSCGLFLWGHRLQWRWWSVHEWRRLQRRRRLQWEWPLLWRRQQQWRLQLHQRSQCERQQLKHANCLQDIIHQELQELKYHWPRHCPWAPSSPALRPDA